MAVLFPAESFEDSENLKIDFSSSRFEEEYDLLTNILEDKIVCIDHLKLIYDWALLADIRKGFRFLSEGKVEIYEKHKHDLRILKNLVKKFAPGSYRQFFSDASSNGNYASFIGMTKKNNKKIPVSKRCKTEDFYKQINSIFKNQKIEHEDFVYMQSEIESGTFMPRQVSKDNSVIPYQMHLEELREILKNAGKYLKFLETVDDTGFSVSQKIEQLMKFRIPYYVGPLNDAHKEKGGNCWIVKRTKDNIRPWNFAHVVDVEKTAEGFITRMTNKCTYLIGADVLPKNSLLYSEYMVLNELNNLRINGEPITVELKKLIFDELFKKIKKVTPKKLVSYLVNEGQIEKTDEISGIDGDFKASLTSLIDFQEILPDKIDNNEMIENLIRWIVLFGEDKKILKKRIEAFYGNELTSNEISKILKLKYMGWGRFSKDFLTKIFHVDKSTGECVSIISALRGELGINLNLMQLLGGGFDFSNAVEEYNQKFSDAISEIDYDLVKELYVSPAIKRSIWQTLTIVEELRRIMQKHPKKIFVEVAREESAKQRTRSRKDFLLELYKSCREEKGSWLKELEAKTDSDLRSDRLYLYYTQMGRCMYSGEQISLADLFNKNIYDVDHIFPRSRVKDDSLENRVLVKRTINSNKSDVYPLPKEIQQKNANFWKSLFDKGFIGKKKFERLIRVTEFDDAELSDFIARQLVETRQSTKAVANILSRIFPETEIVYVKAGNVSEFRQIYDLVKVREINDLHHAKDAYLNIVVGNVYNTRFTHSPLNFIKKLDGKSYNLRRLYEFDVERGGLIAWKSGIGGTITKVRSTMEKNNILFTRLSTTQKGALFDQNLKKKGLGQFKIKGNNEKLSIEKYGGYNNVVGSYFFLVEHEVSKGKKTQKTRTIEFVPVYLADVLGTDKEKIADYCQNELKLVKPEVLVSRIKINTLFNVDGFKMHLSGRTNEQLIFKGANQLIMPEFLQVYLKRILKYLNNCSKFRKEIEITEYDSISHEKNLQLYDSFYEKIAHSVFGKRLGSQKENLHKGRDEFQKLGMFNQCKVLCEILKFFKCSSVKADLKVINGPANAGTLVLSKKLANISNIEIINQSPTGVFEQRIDLLKI